MSAESEEQVKFLGNFFKQWAQLENVIDFSLCF